jgi:hypothetical protein
VRGADRIRQVDQQGEAAVLVEHAVGERDQRRLVRVLGVRVEELSRREPGGAVDARTLRQRASLGEAGKDDAPDRLAVAPSWLRAARTSWSRRA